MIRATCWTIAASCALLCVGVLIGAPSAGLLPPARGFTLSVAAESNRPFSGLAVSAQGRILVGLVQHGDAPPSELGEMNADGIVELFVVEGVPALPPGSVASLTVDARERLWVLIVDKNEDGSPPANRMKLVTIDLKTNTVTGTIAFARTALAPASELGVIRVDAERGFVYLSDTGAGGLVVIDLSSGGQRRVLADHASARWESTALIVDGVPWMIGDRIPQKHAHALALSPDRRFLYFQALSGRTLYRLPTALLQDFDTPEATIAASVERVARPGAVAGMLFDAEGNLYLAAVETNAIFRITSAGRLEVVGQDKERLRWPGPMAFAPDGSLHLVTRPLHFAPSLPGPWRLLRLSEDLAEAVEVED